MKRTIYIGLILVLITVICTCVIFEAKHVAQNSRSQPYYDVYIDDIQVPFYAMRTSDTPYIMFPVLALVESLGGTISWQNDTVADLSFAGKAWEFDCEHVHLHPIGSSSNLLRPPPGSTEDTHFIKSERDAYVDRTGLEHLLFHYLCVRTIDVDDTQQVVRIYTENR